MGLVGNVRSRTKVSYMKCSKDCPVTFRLARAEFERLQRLAKEVGRPISVLLRLAVRGLRRGNVPHGWLRNADIERSVGRPR